jgi:hypothetical protein
MKPAVRGVTVLLLTALAFPSLGLAQQKSLADLAREQRARKGQSAPQGKVYTNEDIPAPSMAPAPAQEATTEAQEGERAASAEPEQAQPESGTTSTSPESQAALEKEYRDKFAKLREELDLQERKLDVMQRELNLMQQQYYSDPNIAMREQTTRDEINKRTADIESQKLSVEKAKEAIAGLEEELRRKNLPPGWAR